MFEESYGPLPSWFSQKAQDAGNDREWEENYSRDWRKKEQPPESFFEFLNQWGNPKDWVVDQGCGNGRMLLELARKGFLVIGFDRSPKAVEKARNRIRRAGLNASVVQATYYDPNLSLSHFKLGISSQALQYPGCWTRIKEASHKFAQLLQPGGYAYFRLRSARNPARRNFEDVYLPEEEDAFDKGTNVRHCPYPDTTTYKHNFTEDEIRFLAGLYGMEILSITEEVNQPAEMTGCDRQRHPTYQWVAIMRKKGGVKYD